MTIAQCIEFGLKTADRMFGELIEMLEAKGALQNALVIVLSDHGEAMGLPATRFSTTTFRVEGLKAPLKMEDHGHGQSVLSDPSTRFCWASGRSAVRGISASKGVPLRIPVTVEDIAPTILVFSALAGIRCARQASRSCRCCASGQGDHAAGPERIRFTETDLRVLPKSTGGVDEVATARQNSVFFEVSPVTAAAAYPAGYAPLAVAYKERAAFTKDQLLAAMPAGPYAHQYILI